MKRAIILTLIFSAATLFAANKNYDYYDWAAPSKSFSSQNVTAGIGVVWAGGQVGSIAITANLMSEPNRLVALIDAELSKSQIPDNAKNAFGLAKSALAQAIYATFQAEMAAQEIESLAASIETVVNLTAADKVDSSGRVISKGNIDNARAALLAKKKSVVNGGSATTGEGSNSDPIQITVTEFNYDDMEFEQRTDNNKSKMALKGYKELTADSNYSWSDYMLGATGIWLPAAKDKDHTLSWVCWKGWNSKCFSAGDDVSSGQNNQQLRLRNWTAPNTTCDVTLQNVLTNKNSTTDRQKHWVLTRYGDSSGDADLHWMRFDENAMELGGTASVDDKSIVEWTDTESATQEKKLAIKGFHSAAPEAATDPAKVPYVDSTAETDGLKWGNMLTFFSDNVFKKSDSTGKILLNGTSEEAGKVSILAIKTGGEGEAEQSLSTFSCDQKSVDGGFTPEGSQTANTTIQLHGFNAAAKPTGYDSYNFADALTNQSANIANMFVPVRAQETGGAEVRYIPMGKVTGIPAAPVDDKTIALITEEGATAGTQKLAVKGANTSSNYGKFFKLDDEGNGTWADASGIETEDEEFCPVSIYEGDGSGDTTEGVKYVTLRNWSTFDSPCTLFGTGTDGKPKSYKESDQTSIDISGGGIEIAGYDDASNNDIPFKKTDGNGMGWAGVGNGIAITTSSGTSKVGISGFENGGGCSVTLNKMLSDSTETSNRSQHQVLCRYSGGSTPAVHWVSMDGTVTPTLSAGNGISITDTTDGGKQIASTDSGNYGSITFVSDVSWDKENHQLKITKTTATVKMSGGTSVGTPIIVLTATSHYKEHEDEDEDD